VRGLLYRVGEGPPTLTDIDIDTPRPDEVLVRVQAAGVCHSDLQFMETRETSTPRGLYGMYGAKREARLQPGITERRTEEREADMLVMGHEPCGTVLEVGSAVRAVVPGDRVIAIGMSNCGRCRSCLAGLPHLCLTLPRRSPSDTPRLSWQGRRVTQFANVGAFAEQILVHETSLVKIGDDIPAPAAAILGCCVATGVGSAMNTARVTPFSSVAVFGTGGIGMSALQGSSICGAGTVIAVDPSPGKRELARTLGATHVIDPGSDDPVDAILEITVGQGVDFSFETTAIPEVAQQAYDVLGLRGRLTCLSSAPADIRTVVSGERVVQGSYLGSTRPQTDIPYYLDLYRQGRLHLEEMVGKCIAPDEFESVDEILAAGGAARVVIDFEG
jgi:S-(hydroxymethyl)glutathione dehydrogenase / alcohol dehydrogenase